MLSRACICAGAVILLSIVLESALGQQRPAESELLRIQRLTAVGTRAKAVTPMYQTSAGGGVKRAQEWHIINATYQTAPEWLDDLLVQFYALSATIDPATRQNVYSLFKKSVRYTDIESGRDHRAMAFLRPAAIKRFGEVVACAVVFTLDGNVVDEKSDQSITLPDFWWRNPQVIDSPALLVREGYLLNRMESPWALINPDDYEVIK